MNQIDSAKPRYGTLDTEYAVEMLSIAAEEDGPIWMVNLMKMEVVSF